MCSRISLNDSDWIHRARGLLADGYRLCRASSQFAPQLCYGRHRGPASVETRTAAVIALLYPNQEDWHLPLILRPASMNHHARQIGLPGGGNEAGESPRQCALRELEEELAVRPDQIQIIGQLAPIFVFASNFYVTPYVAVSRARPSFCPDRSEVEALFEVPVARLLDPGQWKTELIKRGQLEFRAPSFAFQGRYIWGATGLILGQLSAVIGRLWREP